MGDNASASGVPKVPAPMPHAMPQAFHPQAYAAGQQYAQQFAQHYVAQNQQPAGVQTDQMRSFWQQQQAEIENVPADPAEFKNHQLPLARIKKIMKSDEDVRMISAEAPVLFAKACELFILELTLRSWNHAEENKRRTLQRTDVAAAITRTDIFDFLVDIVPREEAKQEGEGMTAPTAGPGPMAVSAQRPPTAAALAPPMGQLYYPYPPQGLDPSAMLRPPMPIDPLMFQQQQLLGNMPGAMPGQPWPQPPQMVQPVQQQGADVAAQQAAAQHPPVQIKQQQ